MSMSDADADASDTDSTHDLEQFGLSLIEAVLARQPHANIQTILRAGAPAWYQDGDGWSALHAAAHVEDPELISLLLQGGAVWNAGASLGTCVGRAADLDAAVDNLGNCAGDIALSMNNMECYNILRDAGVRSGACSLLDPRGRQLTSRRAHPPASFGAR
jgi:protein arginine N-methyltransferase 2